MAVKTSRRRYGTKLRHCQRMYFWSQSHHSHNCEQRFMLMRSFPTHVARGAVRVLGRRGHVARSCLSCCWSKGVERPAKRCYVGLVSVGVLEQAEDILVPPLLRNCLTLNYISFSQSLSHLQNSGPCNSFHCIGHSKNIYDDDDDDDGATVQKRRNGSTCCLGRNRSRTGQIRCVGWSRV